MKNRNMNIFTAGRLVSLLGTYMYQFAAGLYVLKLTGSGVQFALTLIMGTLPRVIAAPFAGVLADRWDRKKIIVTSDIISGLTLLLTVFMVGSGSVSVALIYVSTIILTTCNTFFDVSIEAAKPSLVELDQLERLNSISYGIHALTSIAGPILGGVVYALISFKLFIVLNGLSFIFSGITEMYLKFDDSMKLESVDDDFKTALLGGVAYLKENRFAVALMSFSVSINFCLTLSITVPIPYLFNTILDMSSRWVGLVSAGFPVGYLIGTVLINFRRVENRGLVFIRGVWIIWFSMAIMATLLILFKGLDDTLLASLFAVMLAVIGGAIAYIDIPLMTFLQTAIQNEVRGRVFSIMTMVSRLAMPFAMLLAGQFINLYHPMYLLVTGAVLYLIVILTVVRTVYFQEYIKTNHIKVKAIPVEL